MLSCCGMLTLVVCLTCGGVGRATQAPTTEFDIPYQVRVLSDGTVLEVSGSFSWALPQNVQAMLAEAPQVRVVRLESPGGHLLPALQVATIIQQRGLDTYVGRLCASACTIAFLGGHQRWLAPDARLGFHQASAPGFPPEQANALLQTAYEKFAVPLPFVAHVLRTPHTGVWYPTQDELRAVHYTTGAPPASALALGSSPFPRLSDITRLLPAAPDNTVVEFATVLSDLVRRSQEVNPEACWAFAHEGPDDPRSALPQTILDAVAAAQRGLAESAKATRVQEPAAEKRKKVAADLRSAMLANGRTAKLEGLRAGADHAAFCPSLHELLEVALALPAPNRVLALRAILSGG
jgi:hypothetical protein